MDVCRNCHKVIEGAPRFNDEATAGPFMCPWCMQDARFGPVGRVVNSIRERAAIVLFLVGLVVIGVGWLSGWIRF